MQRTTTRVVGTHVRSLARRGRSLIMRCIDSRRCRNIVRGRLPPGGFMQRLMLVSAVGALAACFALPVHAPSAAARLEPTQGNATAGHVPLTPKGGKGAMEAEGFGFTPGGGGFHIPEKS